MVLIQLWFLSAVKNRVDGLTATRLRQFGDEYDVVVRLKKDARSTLTDIENIGISNPTGQIIQAGRNCPDKGILVTTEVLNVNARNVL